MNYYELLLLLRVSQRVQTCIIHTAVLWFIGVCPSSAPPHNHWTAMLCIGCCLSVCDSLIELCSVFMSVISPYHSGNSCLNFRYSLQLSALLSPTSISFFTLSELPLSDGRLEQTHLSMQAADCSMRHWKVIKGLCGGLEPIIGGWMPQPLLGGVVAGWPVTPSFTGLVRESGDLSTLCVVPQWWTPQAPQKHRTPHRCHSSKVVSTQLFVCWVSYSFFLPRENLNLFNSVLSF